MSDTKTFSNAPALRYSAAPRDLQGIKKILESTAVFKPHEIDVAVELAADGIKNGSLSEYSFIFADYGYNTAGYICYGPITMTERRFDIYWLAVDGLMHRKGIGSLLLGEAEKQIEKLGGAYVFVDTSSREVYQGTRKFYRDHAYREVARIPDYYADGDDKIVFMKNITASKDSEE